MSVKTFDTHLHLLNVNPLVLPSSQIFLNVTTRSSEWAVALELARQSNNVLTALGIHPWFVNEQSSLELKQLKWLLERNTVDCIGEVGLDFYEEYLLNKQLQLDVFSEQLAISSEFSLPLSLHCRKAWQDLIKMLSAGSYSGVIHGYTGSIELAERFLSVGMRIGIGKNLLNPNFKKLRQTVKQLDLIYMVVETDYSGDSGFGMQIEEIIKEIGLIKNITFEEVAITVYGNAKKIFGEKI